MNNEVRFMLLEFEVENFKSIRSSVLLNLRATSIREHPGFLIKKNEVGVLPVISVYGANASGKSNLLEALWVLRKLVNTSHVGYEQLADKKNKQIPVRSYFFNNEPTSFRMVFEVNGVEYTYSLKCTSEKVLYERLEKKKFSKNDTKSKLIFERNENNEIFTESPQYDDLKNYSYMLSNTILAITLFLVNKKLEFGSVNFFFNGLFFVKPGEAFFTDGSDIWFSLYDKDSKMLKDCNAFIREIDPCFEELKIDKEKGLDNEIRYKPMVLHHGEYYPLNMESDGTKRMLYLYAFLYVVLKTGGIFVVDELDCQLHPLLMRKIVRMFHDSKQNLGQAQLIFSAHNLILMNRREMRRDEIWIVEKDCKGCTELFSLSDFKTNAESIRSDLDYGKHYLAGRFGGIPFQNF